MGFLDIFRRNNPILPPAEEREHRRSRVRVGITWFAAAFLFGGGAIMVGWRLVYERYEDAQDLFLTILPIASSIVAYGFATRATRQDPESSAKPKGSQGAERA